MGLKSGSKSGKGGKSNGKLNAKHQPANLGNDSGSDDEPQIDLSVLRQSIDLSVKRFGDLIKIFTNGTNEIKNILDHQCDIIYECKICKSLFRSVANLISHKRAYCKKEYCAAENTRSRNDVVEDYTWIVQPEPVPSSSHNNQDWITSDAEVSSDQASAQISSAIPPISSYTKPKKDLSKIIERLGQKASVQTITETMGHASASHLYEEISKKVIARNNDRKDHAIHLESMENTKVGVFQTKLCTTTTTTTTSTSAITDNTDLMKAQICELQYIESDNEAILDSNGQIVVNGPTKTGVTSATDIANEQHVCQQCNQRFSTRKTLSHHVKSLHVTFRMCYPCPCCKSSFVNTWSVYRHLYKVHRKSTTQVRKLRQQIQKKAFRKDTTEESSTTPRKVKNATMKELHRLDQDWMNNFEDDQELQRCGGCGRRFERRAALNSHSQICQKRIAARNNIKLTRLPVTTPPNVVEKVMKPEVMEPVVSTPKKTETPSPSKRCVSPVQTTEAASTSPAGSPFSRAQVQQNNTGSWCDQTKKDIPEKRIEIQIRRDYIKIGGNGSGISVQSDAQSECSSRPHSCAAGEEGEDCEVWDVDKFEADDETNSVSSSKPLEREDRNTDDDSIEVIGEVIKNHGSGSDSFSFNLNCPLEASQSGSTKELDGLSNETSPFTYSVVNCSETKPTLTVQPIVSSGNARVNECNKRKRPASAIVRHHVGTDSSTVQKLVKVTPAKKPKNVMMQLSPVMENRMQELINSNRLQCLLCQKKCNKLTNLRRHVSLHMGWNRYQCVECPYKCFSKYDCVSHVNKVHLKGGLRSKALPLVKYIEADEQESGANPINHLLLARITEQDSCHEPKVLQLKSSDLLLNSPAAEGSHTSASSKAINSFSDEHLKSEEGVILEPRIYSLHSPSHPSVDEDNKDFDTSLESLVNEESEVFPNRLQDVSPIPVCKTIKQEPVISLNNGDLTDSKDILVPGEKMENEDACSITDDAFISLNNEGSMSPTHQDRSALEKMVMEVIFGSGGDTNSDANQPPLYDIMNGVRSRDNPNSRSSSTASDFDSHLEQNGESSVLSGSSSLNVSPSSKSSGSVIFVENERRERPVRNRVKVTRDDFIYDLSDACLNPKKEPDSHSNHVVSKSSTRRKLCDSIKELSKQGGVEGTSVANNFESSKCVPKLMLIRTDGGESSAGKRVNIGAKGTWSTFSATTSDCSSEKDVNSALSSGSYNISTRKSQRVFDTTPVKAVDHAKDK